MDEERLKAALRFGRKNERATPETEGTRLLGGRYVLAMDDDGEHARILLMQGAEQDAAAALAAARALLLSDPRWRRALAIPLAAVIPLLDTRDRPTLIRLIGGLARLVEYARYLTAFHPREVITVAARLAAKGYGPQPAWPGPRPPNASIAASTADLVAWDDRGAGERPTPRLRRFPQGVFAGEEVPLLAKTVATLALLPHESTPSVSEGQHRDAAFVRAATELLFEDPVIPEGANATRYAVALFFALSGRLFEEAGSELPPDGVDDVLCLRVAETLGRLHFRKAPALLF